MLHVSVSVNGGSVLRVAVQNLGPVGGVYGEGDGPGGGGEREYRWVVEGSDECGVVTHRRSDGAEWLAAMVISAVATMRSTGAAAR